MTEKQVSLSDSIILTVLWLLCAFVAIGIIMLLDVHGWIRRHLR